MKTQQIHMQPDGTYFGPHQDPSNREIIRNIMTYNDIRTTLFLHATETMPDLNEQYAPELEAVQRLFADEGLAIGPIKILSSTEFDDAYQKACNQSGMHIGQANGFHIRDRAFVREPDDDPKIPELLGADYLKDYVLGVAIHEAAHSAGAHGESRFIVTQEPESALDIGSIVVQDYVQSSSLFTKIHLTREAGILDDEAGIFLEEGYADLKRVKGLEKLGRGPKVGSKEKATEYEKSGLIFVGDGIDAPVKDEETGMLSVPLRFADKTRTLGKGMTFALATTRGLAAYGLELLDQKIPGLLQQMDNARNHPGEYKKAIAMINQVEPGLYKQLRELQDNAEDFKKGLGIIADVLDSRTGEGKNRKRETLLRRASSKLLNRAITK